MHGSSVESRLGVHLHFTLMYMQGVLEKVEAILTRLTGQFHWPSIATFILCQLLVMALAVLSHELLVFADESVKAEHGTIMVPLMT